MKEELIILTGPTAVGKTALSIKLAKSIGAEIISADSMQVYRGMDIGTAKIKQFEMDGVKHHLIDILEPDDEFNVVIFKELALKAIKTIRENGHIPLIVGGTGFYIQALLYDINFTENGPDKSYRHYLESILLSEGGADILYDMLKSVDPKSAQKIHKNNSKRIIRALEYYNETGQQISEHNENESSKPAPYNYAYFVLTKPREELYSNIDKRVDMMIEDDLVDEVKRLKTLGYSRELVSMQGLGYKEILAWLDGEMTYDEALYTLKRDTRHFAKRQLTWFRRERDVIWIDKSGYPDDETILDFMIDILKQKSIV